MLGFEILTTRQKNQSVLDGRIIGTGEMGPVTARLRALYRDLVTSCT